MVRLVLGSVQRPMVRPTGGATSPAGHHQDPSFFFSLFFSMALLSVPQVVTILMAIMVEMKTRL